MSCYMGACFLSAGGFAMIGCELCVGIGFDSVTAEGAQEAIQDGNMCDIGPGGTLNAVATVGYLAVAILLCW